MKGKVQTENPAKWMEDEIRDFIDNSPENTLGNRDNEKAWKEPLIGFSRGGDPLYREYKRSVGNFHWTPLEIFSNSFPSLEGISAKDLTVISWVLPQSDIAKSDNRKESAYPSERWARARVFGEQVNFKLAKHVVRTLEKVGFMALAPSLLSPLFKWIESERFGIASNWSERHAAYASGLGTFGLCDGLITSRGKAMRCGSVVANIKIPASKRPYQDYHAYCLFFSTGACGKCIQRCPVGALTSAGHDKVKCRSYLFGEVREYVTSHYGFDGPGIGCGLCQTDVPCESKIPMKDL